MVKVKATKMDEVGATEPAGTSAFITQSKAFKKTVKVTKIGESYQADIPDILPRTGLADQEELAFSDWKPTDKLKDEELGEFVAHAKKDFGYVEEQALAILTWNDFDVAKTKLQLPLFVNVPFEFTKKEQMKFGTIIHKYGTDFRRLRQCFPNTPVSDLVTYYYSKWKLEKKKRKVHLPGRKLTPETESEASASSFAYKGESEDGTVETDEEMNENGKENSGSDADEEDMDDSNSVATSPSQEEKKNVADKDGVDETVVDSDAQIQNGNQESSEDPDGVDMTMTFYNSVSDD